MDDTPISANATPTSSTPAGWYTDASDAHKLRWWNGSGWTPAVRPNTTTVEKLHEEAQEHVIALARVDPFFAFAPPVLLAIFVLGGRVLFGQVWGDTGANVALILILLIAGPLGTLLLIRAILQLTSNRFTLTNRRITAQYGLLSRRTHELLLGQIESIRVSQGIFARSVGYGTVLLWGTGGLSLPLKGIRNAIGFQAQIKQQVELTITKK